MHAYVRAPTHTHTHPASCKTTSTSLTQHAGARRRGLEHVFLRHGQAPLLGRGQRRTISAALLHGRLLLAHTPEKRGGLPTAVSS